MKDLKIWRFILNELQDNEAVIFLCVMESIGSSPGRQGFKMAVSARGMQGSVGGGIMEHKFVELAKNLLREGSDETLIKQQVHSKNAVNQSGMICSGEQTLAIYPVKESDKKEIEKIIAALEKDFSTGFEFSAEGIHFTDQKNKKVKISFEEISDSDWRYTEQTGYKDYLHIIGAGHVSYAFSKLMRDLDFHISVYDDRDELNTMMQNDTAHVKQLVNYENIENIIPEGENQYVVIMTFGYRSDALVIRQLLKKNFRYIGILGSKAKIAKLIKELHDENYDESLIKKIHAPIGIQIKSETPEEIAVSIAAEIIAVRNNLRISKLLF